MQSRKVLLILLFVVVLVNVAFVSEPSGIVVQDTNPILILGLLLGAECPPGAKQTTDR